MADRELDLRGLSCPAPALGVKKELASLGPGDRLSVLVDCGSAEQNVPRAADKAGWSLASSEVLPDRTRRLVFSRKGLPG